MACDEAVECCVAGARCGGVAIFVFVVLLAALVLYNACSRKMQVNAVKAEHQRQESAKDAFANLLGAGFGSLTMDQDTIRAAHKGLEGAIPQDIRVRLASAPCCRTPLPSSPLTDEHFLRAARTPRNAHRPHPER